MDDKPENRLRTPPRERFSGETKVYDTLRIFDQLAGEEHDGVAGHRQITLFKSGTSTIVAFLFDEGSVLPEHRADGVATLHVLDGRLEVTTPDNRHEVGGDGLLVLRPKVPHEVRAMERTKMILTVHLHAGEPASSDASVDAQ